MNFCVPETSLHTSFQEMLADSIACPHATHSGCSGQKPPHARESSATTKQTGTRSQIPCSSNSGKTKPNQTHSSLGRSLCLEHMGETLSHSADETEQRSHISKQAPHPMHGHTPDASITASQGRDFLTPVCANSGSTVIQLLQSRLTTLKVLVSK